MSIVAFQQAAEHLIRTYGGAATLTTYTEGSELNGEVIGQVEKVWDVTLAVFDYPQVGAGDKANFNTLIQEGDIQAFMLPVSITCREEYPDIKPNSSLVTIGKTTWRVMNTKVVSPNSQDKIIHDLHLRK